MMTILPQGWAVIYGFGIRQIASGQEALLANVALGQDDLQSAEEFDTYLAAQAKMIQSNLIEPKIAGPQPTSFPDCDEARMMIVLHTPEADTVIHVQTYVRIGLWVGIITLTASQQQLQSVRPYSDQFTKGLRVLPAPDSTDLEPRPAAPLQT
ncbi:hypothetical protein [Granulicella paludicola]|uniref:hypothetical protein n=1 Tax=Granulicella paludicola TaxID=474951 RepID=UPI0021DFD1DF|nr:hypothetical protein [Granulicella paludicola]